MAYFFKKNMLLRHFFTAPVIWAVLAPLIFLDVVAEIYHQIGFRLCRIPLAKRSAYIKIDRRKLKYLNFFCRNWVVLIVVMPMVYWFIGWK